jgi:hypothetical protein
LYHWKSFSSFRQILITVSLPDTAAMGSPPGGHHEQHEGAAVGSMAELPDKSEGHAADFFKEITSTGAGQNTGR